MGKHTAGPWKVSSSILVCSEDGEVIANCLSMPEILELSIGIEESSANAALISAAPDLLQALEAIMADYDAWQKGDIENPIAIVNEEKAIAAIARARGQ